MCTNQEAYIKFGETFEFCASHRTSLVLVLILTLLIAIVIAWVIAARTKK